MRRGVLLAAITFLVLACQQAPPVEPPAPGKPPAVVLREGGDGLAGKGDYAGAVAKYQAATGLEPDDMGIRFALGSAYSYLNRRPEAVVQFKIVIARAAPTTQEYQLAHQWLVSVGELRPEAEMSSTPDTPGEAKPDPAAPAVAQGPTTSLRGELKWKGVEKGRRRIPVRLTLTGEDTENRSIQQVRVLRISERYNFPNIPPGSYRIVGLALEPRETPLWDMKVNVEKDKETLLVLSGANSSTSEDSFPPPE